MKTKRTRNQMCVLGAFLLLHAIHGLAQPVTNVAAGNAHSLFLKSDGSLWGMGYNNAGQLGDGTQNDTNRPTMIASNVTAMAGGGSHTLFVKRNGSLWAVGNNTYGQLGDGAFLVNARTIPEQIDDNGVTAVASGFGHSLFLKNGDLWAMGYNTYGQLGDGNFSYSSVNYLPERIATGGITAIAAGYEHSLFIKSDGSLWAMGNNPDGRLGDGTYSSGNPSTGVSQPEQIVGSNVTAIAAGQFHSLFLKIDGSLWAMGGNVVGQLGAGNFTMTNRPVLVVSSNVTAIAAGGSRSLFLMKDGSLWGMGDSLFTTNAYQPARILAGGVTAIAAGHTHSLFVTCGGSLWAVGGNNKGQSGNGFNSSITNAEQTVSAPGYNRITSKLILDGGWRFSYVGIAGSNYVLERTLNLSVPDWLPQATNTAEECGALLFTNAPGFATSSFWRVRSVR